MNADFQRGCQRLRSNDPALIQLDLNNVRTSCGCTTDDEFAHEFADALQHNTVLTLLAFTSNFINDASAEILASALRRNTTLTALNLERNVIGTRGANALAEALLRNRSSALTSLRLHKNVIGDDGAAVVATALRHNVALIELDVGHNYISNVGAEHFANALLHNTTLTTLTLRRNHVKATGANHLAAALSRNTTLAELDVSDNLLSDAGASAFADALRHNTGLTTLNLNANNIGAVGADNLARALQHNATLTTLELGNNQMHAVGAKVLARALQHNNVALTSLDLTGNCIDADGVADVVDLIRCNTALTTLNLSWNVMFHSKPGEARVHARRVLNAEQNILSRLAAATNSRSSHTAPCSNDTESFRSNDVVDSRNFSALPPTLPPLSPSTASGLADALRHNTTLRSLNLRATGLDSVGIAHVARALRHHPTLSTLDVSASTLTGVAVAHLANMMQTNAALTSIRLTTSDFVCKRVLVDALRHNWTLTVFDTGPDNQHLFSDVIAAHLARNAAAFARRREWHRTVVRAARLALEFTHTDCPVGGGALDSFIAMPLVLTYADVAAVDV